MYIVHNIAIFFLSFVVIAIPVVAYTRMVVDDANPRGPLYFRLGPKEIMVAIDYIILLIVTYLVLIVAVLIVVAAFFVVAAGMGSPEDFMEDSPGTAILMMFGAFLFVLGSAAWIWAKLGLAIPIAVQEGGLGFRRAWGMSKGHTGSLFFALIGTYFLMVLLMIAMIIVLGIVAGIILVPLGMLAANTDLTWLVIAVAVVLYIAFYVVLYCVTTAIPTGVFAEAYRLIKGSSAVAETFD